LANFVYGDSCVTGDDKYVIAQFRHDAPMAWVGELRAFLVQNELKYKHFAPQRHRVQANAALWKRVKAGVEQAEITIIDPVSYRKYAFHDFRRKGAEYGHDFNDRGVFEQASRALIEFSPLRAAQLYERDRLMFAGTACETTSFSTAEIIRRVGGKHNDAVITAARAHAMISPSEKRQLIRLCARSTRLGLGYYPEDGAEIIRKIGRVFDVEHAKSVDLLNDFSERIAEAVGISYNLFFDSPERAVSEAKSERIDHIQAADIAAGWAVDTLLLTRADYKVLAKQFAWVAVNGVAVPG
jgi:hypothetical protein